MCCFCCGPKRCLCWFCFSIGLCLIILTIVGFLEVYLGGPLPTFSWDLMYKLIYAGNAVSIIFCAFSLLAIRHYGAILVKKADFISKLLLLLILNAGLLCPMIVGGFFIKTIHTPITVGDVAEYTAAYFAKNEEPPPTIQWLERYSTEIQLPFISFGCCGAESYEDYIDELPECDRSSPRNFMLQFVGSPSCCTKKIRDDPLCASSLQVIDYEIKFYFWQRFMAEFRNMTSAKKASLEKLALKIQVNLVEQLAERIRSGGTDQQSETENFTPKFDCPEPTRRELMRLVPDWDSQLYAESPVEGQGRIRVYPVAYLEMKKFFEQEGISVLGCARLLMTGLEMAETGMLKRTIADAGIPSIKWLLKIVQLVFTILGGIKLGLQALCVIILNWYYMRLILLKHETAAGQNVGHTSTRKAQRRRRPFAPR